MGMMGIMSIMGIIATLHHHGYHMGIMGIIIIEITIISATLHDCQTDQVPSVQDDMIVQRKDVEFHVYSYCALPVLPSLPFPSFPGDRWGGVVVLVVGVAGRRWERGMGTGGGRVRVEGLVSCMTADCIECCIQF